MTGLRRAARAVAVTAATLPPLPGRWQQGSATPERPCEPARIARPFGHEPGVADLAAECVGLWRRRMIDGAWVVAEGAIYDVWDESRRVVSELSDIRQYFTGIDYGTNYPFAAVLLGEEADDRLYVVAEWRHDSRTRHRSMADAQYSAAVAHGSTAST